MSWPSVGGRNVITIRNWRRNSQGDAVALLKMRGVDGVGAILLGKNAQPTTFESVVDIAAPDTEYDAYRALCGTLITVVNDFGTSISNVLALDVSIVDCHYVSTASGGCNSGAAYLLTCGWSVIETTV